jgi:hypothetical protein
MGIWQVNRLIKQLRFGIFNLEKLCHTKEGIGTVFLEN